MPTYESCSTAAFLKGRTECIRSATLATRETVLALQEWENSIKAPEDSAKLLNLFRKCSDIHTQLVKEAAMGTFYFNFKILFFKGMALTAICWV